MGIYFGSESTDSLGVYEEGTFTPTFSGGSNFNVNSATKGEYVRVGTLVHIRAFLSFGNPAFTSGGQSWNIVCGGLPYAPSTGSYGSSVISISSDNHTANSTSGNYIFGIVSESAATLSIKTSQSNTPAATNVTAAMCGNYTSWVIAGTYHVN